MQSNLGHCLGLPVEQFYNRTVHYVSVKVAFEMGECKPQTPLVDGIIPKSSVSEWVHHPLLEE